MMLELCWNDAGIIRLKLASVVLACLITSKASKEITAIKRDILEYY